uniref:BED-type domain-containing protein n=1 Tax=Aegilops tauschii subsp. strangulata TaxID=200361 RepID=A0A452ZXG3_AEGTS
MDEDADHVILSDDEDGQEEEVEEVNEAGKRKLTSKVWLEMKKMRINRQWKAKCNYCHKELASGPRAGTKHLASHLKICTLKMLKMKGGKTLSQPSLRMNANEDGNVFLESYTFDQEVARRELGNMLVLHEYPLSIVDHAGFRKFVHALQPLFKLHTRNTIRYTLPWVYLIYFCLSCSMQ